MAGTGARPRKKSSVDFAELLLVTVRHDWGRTLRSWLERSGNSLDEAARIPTCQWLALLMGGGEVVEEITSVEEFLAKHNEMRARKGLPPVATPRK